MSEKGLVLVVEDDFDIRNLIRLNLKRKGFEVVAVETGEEGLAKARELSPLVITLDLMLPGINGLQVCQQLRNDEETADLYIIMVTALGEADDRITGFKIGADDYISKPFQIEELVLRVEAASKRMKRFRATEVKESTLIERGHLKIDQAQHRVWINEVEINMTITEYKLLLYLVNKQGDLCSRGELLEKVWELPPNLNTRTVDTHIKRLRQKLENLSDYIETVRGAGYRFAVST